MMLQCHTSLFILYYTCSYFITQTSQQYTEISLVQSPTAFLLQSHTVYCELYISIIFTYQSHVNVYYDPFKIGQLNQGF